MALSFAVSCSNSTDPKKEGGNSKPAVDVKLASSDKSDLKETPLKIVCDTIASSTVGTVKAGTITLDGADKANLSLTSTASENTKKIYVTIKEVKGLTSGDGYTAPDKACTTEVDLSKKTIDASCFELKSTTTGTLDIELASSAKDKLFKASTGVITTVNNCGTLEVTLNFKDESGNKTEKDIKVYVVIGAKA